MKLVVSIGKKCWLFHKYTVIEDNGFTVYSECDKCQTRKVTQPRGGLYQPIDWKWVSFKDNARPKRNG